METEDLKRIIKDFSNKKILVIGDIILDKYVYGNVSRINPEAPVPIVNVEKEEYHLGGTGNVVSNLESLGGKVMLFSFIGKDSEAEIVKELLDRKNIKYCFDNEVMTIQKTRIIGNNQQIVRIDKEKNLEKIFTKDIKKILLEKAQEADIIVISDYGKGVINQDLMNLLNNHKKKMIIDPKQYDKIDLYKDAYLITPNKRESFEMSKCTAVEQAGEKLKQELNSNILITLGKKGMVLFSDKKLHLPTKAREVYEVSGAGDTVIAALALALASKASLEQAIIISNHAAGIAVEKVGTYSVSLKELEQSFFSDEKKLVNLEDLKKIVSDLKLKNKKIVFTNGCYDILHPGHITILTEASKHGDVLIVALNSDSSIKRLKGEERPFLNQDSRAHIVGNIKGVDYVTLFYEDNIINLLNEIKPDILIKGGDPLPERLISEKQILDTYGGKLVLLPMVKGFSSTNIIEKIRKQENGII